MPVVHVKSRGTKIDRVGHLGSINSFESFAFPVCSLYIPCDLKTDGIGISEKDSNRCEYTDLPNLKRSARYNFFVLQKGRTYEKFNESPLMLMYRLADLEILNKTDYGHNIVSDAEIKEYKNIEGNDIFVRIVENPSNIQIASDSGKQIFKEISEHYNK